MNLDELYGSVVHPKWIKPHEKRLSPLSLQPLSAETSALLNAYLGDGHKLELLNVFPVTFHILWLMDANGDIWFALEELIDQDDVLVGVLPRIISVRPAAFTKLGHPSLAPFVGSLARIAGEIVFDPDLPPKAGEPKSDYVLTNESGRYGMRPEITPAHLSRVASKFSTFGIHLKTMWFQGEPE